MPRLIETESRTDVLVDALNELLATEGIPGLTMRKIARVSGVSTGSMIHHFGGKARLLQLGAALTARALHDDLKRRRVVVGVHAFLPSDDDGIVHLRSWLGWCELARSDANVELPVQRARRDERGLLAQTLGHRLSHDELALTVAVIDGLRGDPCAPTRPLPPPRARELLTALLERLGVAADPPTDGYDPYYLRRPAAGLP